MFDSVVTFQTTSYVAGILTGWLIRQFFEWFFRGKKLVEPSSPAAQLARLIRGKATSFAFENFIYLVISTSVYFVLFLWIALFPFKLYSSEPLETSMAWFVLMLFCLLGSFFISFQDFKRRKKRQQESEVREAHLASLIAQNEKTRAELHDYLKKINRG